MIATQTKTIDGFDFSVTQLPGMRALKMLNRLLRVLGPGLAKLLGQLQGAQKATGGRLTGAADLLATDLSEVGDALGELFSNLSEDELESITRALLDGATVRHAEITNARQVPLLDVLDRVMQGRVLVLLQLLRFTVEVNYADFFDAVRGRAQAVAAAKATTPTSA